MPSYDAYFGVIEILLIFDIVIISQVKDESYIKIRDKILSISLNLIYGLNIIMVISMVGGST